MATSGSASAENSTHARLDTLGGLAAGVVRTHPDPTETQHMTTSDTCYRLVVAGRLSQTVTQMIDARFGAAASVSFSGTDTVVDLAADQAALRAVVTLIWDLGHDLVAVRQYSAQFRSPGPLPPTSPADGPPPHPQPGQEPTVSPFTTTPGGATP